MKKEIFHRFTLWLVLLAGLGVFAMAIPQALAWEGGEAFEDVNHPQAQADPPIDPMPLRLEDAITLMRDAGFGDDEGGNLPSNPALKEIQNTDAAFQNKTLTTVEAAFADRLEKPLRLFGYDLFEQNAQKQQGRPDDDRHIPTGLIGDDYRLSAGDSLEIIFRGQENSRQIETIDHRGMLVIETLDPVLVAGKTLGTVKNLLRDEAMRLHNLDIYVALQSARQIDVLVIGHVKDPGRKTLTAFHSVLDALNAAGGVMRSGSLRQIKLVRQGHSRNIDLYDVLIRNGIEGDIGLQDGDRIIIPPIGATMAVAGAVKRPALYELKSGENVSTIAALSLAGGVTSPGKNRFTRLSLTNGGEEQVENITNPSNAYFGDGSVLYVSLSKQRRVSEITLKGSVRDPGIHDLSRASDLSALIGDQKQWDPSAYPLIGVIERQEGATLSKGLIEFSPLKVLQKRQNIRLQEGDIIHLFSNAQIENLKRPPAPPIQEIGYTPNRSDDNISLPIQSFLEERFIFVRGAVRHAGGYPVAQATPLEAVIAAAGGLTREADPAKIEITTRMILVDEAHEAMAPNRQMIALDSQEAKTITLNAGDMVRVNQKFNRIAEQSVTLLGEIKNPGKYDLLPGDTLSTLMMRAGGLSEVAYPDGVIFSRAAERRQEQARYLSQVQDLELKLAALLSPKDQAVEPDAQQIATLRSLITQLKSARAVGRITVEADPDTLKHDPEQDILLETGDKIFIPRRPLTVRVGGEVQSPAALQFRKGKTASTYIDEAGGATYFADLDRAFVVYPDGSAQPLSVSAWRQQVTMIPPGSTIIVPRDPKPFNFLEGAEQITHILANIALTGFYIDDLGDDN